MLQGIQFYKSKNFQGFENCEETIEFTNIMNDLFDVLNRKFPAEGIREESKDRGFLNVVWCVTVLHVYVNSVIVIYQGSIL